MELTKEIQEVLKKNLPQMQADEFKEFIEQSARDRNELVQVHKERLNALDELAGLKKLRDRFEYSEKNLLEANNALKVAEDIQRKYALDIKDEQIKQRDYVIKEFAGFIGMLCKNPRAIELISESSYGSMPVKDQYGNNANMPTSNVKTGNREHTEEK